MPQPDPRKPVGIRPANTPVVRDPLQIGVSIVGVTAAFGGAGWWIDSMIGTFPILMAIGSMLGLFGIIYLTYVRLKAEDKASADSPPEDHEHHAEDRE